MKIDLENSLTWRILYWIAEWGNNTAKTNLCPFVRQVLTNGLLLLGVILICVLGTFVFTINFTYLALSLLSVPIILFETAPGLALVITVIQSVLFPIFAIAYIRHGLKYNDKSSDISAPLIAVYEKLTDTTSKQREPNIIVLWLQAKHDKLCPQLEFKKRERK